ncbi:MAG: hypothetical protein ACOC5D_00910 [Thermoplasmatota archaeon]
MEKKIRISSSNSRIISILILAVSSAAGLLSNFLLFSFVPVIGGIIAVLGVRYNKRSRINFGMAIAILSFFLLNYNTAFTIINLSMIIILFLAMMVLWTFAGHDLMTSEIKKDLGNDEDNRYLKEFEHKSISRLAKKMAITISLSFLGSLIALYSYTGTFLIPSLAVPLTLFFAAVFLLIIYILAVYIPKYSEE